MGAYTQLKTSDSWWASNAKKIQGVRMNEWIKYILGIAAAALITWNMVQVHEYRLGKIETAFAGHIEAHEKDIEEIKDSLEAIHIDITRLVAKDGR